MGTDWLSSSVSQREARGQYPQNLAALPLHGITDVCDDPATKYLNKRQLNRATSAKLVKQVLK